MSRFWWFWFKSDSGVARYAQEVLDSGWVPALPAEPGVATSPSETEAAPVMKAVEADLEAPDLLTRFYLNQGC